MITAAEALEMSNGKGERLKLINTQLENILSDIVQACLKGQREISIEQPLPEVHCQLIRLGYELNPIYMSTRLYVRW